MSSHGANVGILRGKYRDDILSVTESAMPLSRLSKSQIPELYTVHRFLPMLLLMLCCGFPLQAMAGQTAVKPINLMIETFAPEHGYITGTEDVILLCVVRNTGADPVPENVMRLRCYPVTGLDYTNGNLLPTLPALAPGEATAFRWRFAPTAARGAIVAGVILESANGDAASPNAPPAPPSPAPQTPPTTTASLPNPQLAFAVVPRLIRAPGIGDIPAVKDPLAHAVERVDDGLLFNGRVAVRAQIGERREAILTLAAREGAIWQTLANSLFLIRANLGEEGQIPWWQNMRCQRIHVDQERESSTLTLTGMVGSYCRAELSLEMRADTCVLTGRVRLTAQRALRLSGLELPALLPAVLTGNEVSGRPDGSALQVSNPAVILPDEARMAAVHGGGATFGIAWPDNIALPFVPTAPWKWSRLPQMPGVRATGSVMGDSIAAGSTLECQFRLFAFAPSGTVRDALRFQIP